MGIRVSSLTDRGMTASALSQSKRLGENMAAALEMHNPAAHPEP
jgi:hypothetical protein